MAVARRLFPVWQADLFVHTTTVITRRLAVVLLLFVSTIPLC